MTEKRFNVFDVDGTVFLEDHIEGSYHIGEKENVDIPCLNDIADRLNTYADENEQLKQREKTLEGMIRTFDEGCKEIYDDKCRLEEENEQLKSDNKCYVKRYSELFEDYIACKKENEQLKSEINEWKDKYYQAEETVINEYSSNISKDMEELQKEVYGDVE